MFLNKSTKVLGLIILLGGLLNSLSVFALDDGAVAASMTGPELYALIQQADPNNSLKLAVTPEVLAEINRLRFDEKARAQIALALQRMENHKATIQTALKNKSLPSDLSVLPLIKATAESSAGLWQLEPQQAKKMGLVIHGNRDDRMNEKLATRATIHYLQALHTQFQDWKLALIAYEIGAKQTRALIKTVGSNDPWLLARDKSAPKNLINYLAAIDASIIIMHNPVLVAGS